MTRARPPAGPRCCPKCFHDAVLVAEVERVGTPGRCRFCRATRPKTVAAADLADLFWPLVHQYAVTTPGEHYDPHDQDAFDVGTPLHEAIQSDWAVFSDRMFVAGRAEGLLAAILDPRDPDALDLSALYTRRDRAYTARSPDDLWWEFAQYVKHERRFVLGRPPAPAPDLRDLLGAGLLRRLARRLRPGRQLYRARVGAAADGARPVPLPPSQMGAPPYALTGRGGRMNAPGIRVLYAALTRDTAVAEVRPWVGADVTVATLALARPARVVDLSDPRRLLVRSPFGHADLDAVLERAETLRVIGAAMSEPVTEDRSPIDYVPTQYAAEVIRARGYDGVVYGSALGRGRNVVLFDPDHARVDDTELVRVAGVRYRLDD